MKTTKDEILRISLKLFAERGYDGVSTSMIAERLGITKGALYRHYKNKQGIFDAIWEKMVQLDAERAEEDHVPAKKLEEDAESYQNTDAQDLCEFVNNQFEFWTENEFARDFRRMITLEQFKNPEMTRLFQDVVGTGPVSYTEDLFNEMIRCGKMNRSAEEAGAYNLALQLYAPLVLMIRLADGGEDKEKLKTNLRQIVKEFEKRWVY